VRSASTIQRAVALAGPLTFTVNGVPIPKGSMQGYWIPEAEKVVMTSDNKALDGWDAKVSGDALEAAGRMLKLQGPIRLTLRFQLHVPTDAPKRRRAYATHKPDGDKLLRAICDALSIRAPSSNKKWPAGSVWRDDAQVVEYHVYKELAYEGRPGVDVQVEELPFERQGRWCVLPSMDPLPSVLPRPALELAFSEYRTFYASKPSVAEKWASDWLTAHRRHELPNCTDDELAEFVADLRAFRSKR
jgi:Holliday junction resolvase RusA-like endonuclease